MITNRIKNLQKRLSNAQAALILSDANRFYLTGFHSSAGFVFVTADGADFYTDFRYYEMAKKAVRSCKVTLLTNTIGQINELIAKYGVTELFVETNSVSVSDFNLYKSRFDNVSVADNDFLDKALCELRSVKNKTEIEHIKLAQKLTDDTFSYILDKISVGRTEKEIMLDMEFYLRRLGSEGVSFDFIVVSGKNSSLPHGVPTDKKIEKGDFVTMDFGAVVNGYRSDMTRTVAVGDATAEMKKVYETVLAAQNAAFDLIAPNAVCRDVDRAARDLINGAGYEGCFGHGLGHSVGIEIHENPSFNTRCETRLAEGMILTVEPGIYLENRFGVRIEDMVLITENGFENLTKSDKNLIIL